MGRNAGTIREELEAVKSETLTVLYRGENGEEKKEQGPKKEMIKLTEEVIRQGRWLGTLHH